METTPRFLTLSEVLTILQDQITRYGGAFGVRDIGLLSSAVSVPRAEFGGETLHADLFEMAAAQSKLGKPEIAEVIRELTG